MNEGAETTTDTRWMWILPLALLLAGGAWVGLRQLDDAPPIPEVTRKSPGEQAVAQERVGGVEGDGIEASGAASAAAVERLRASMEAERAGTLVDALAHAEAAVQLGGGRDAQLQVAKLRLVKGDAEAAVRPLEAILREDPDDADALYNLGLAWQKATEPNYNKARNNYLAALRAEPRYAAARYNLVILCLDHGILDEARHHLERYAEAWPQDEKLARLQAMVQAKAEGPGAGASPASGMN